MREVAAAFTGDLKPLDIPDFDGKVKRWTLSGEPFGELALPEDERKFGRHIFDLAFSPDGAYVAAVVQHLDRPAP